MIARSALLAGVFFILTGAICARASAIPETLNYELSWVGVKIGTSSLRTAHSDTGLEIVSKVNSESWSAPFYKVDDLEISKLNRVGKGVALQSYKMKLHEGRHDWHRVASLDRKNKSFLFVDLLTFEKKHAKFRTPDLASGRFSVTLRPFVRYYQWLAHDHFDFGKHFRD